MTRSATSVNLSRRRFLITASGLATAGLMAACGAPAAPAAPTAKPQEAAPTSKPAAPAAQGTTAPAAKPAASGGDGAKVTIRLFTRQGSEADTLAERLPAFMAEYPKVEVKPETTPGDDNAYLQKLQTLTAGDLTPDVVWLSEAFNWHRRSSVTGTLLAVDDLVKADKYDLSVFYKAAISSLSHEGKLWGLPFKANSGQNLMYLNVDAFAAAGVQQPNADTKLDELITLATKGTKRSGNQIETWGIIPFIKGAGHHMTTFWVRTFDGEVLSEDGKKSLMDTEPAKAGMRWVYDLIHKHKAAPTLKDVTGTLDEMFIAGKSLMLQGATGGLSLPTRVKDKFKMAATLMPKGPSGRRGSLMALDFLAIAGKSKYPTEAFALAKWLCDKETGIRLGEGTGGASGTTGARYDVMKDPRISGHPLRGPVIDGITSAEPARLTANYRDNEFWRAAVAGLEPLWLGDTQPTDDFFKGLNSEMQKILDKPPA